mmetsp:Transcript_3823/g.4508  ORF Transcript_3823/g.4508 Transcript_3823/m.4508 type:complete len:95 (-) Transcript_3823:123-407(-)
MLQMLKIIAGECPPQEATIQQAEDYQDSKCDDERKRMADERYEMVTPIKLYLKMKRIGNYDKDFDEKCLMTVDTALQKCLEWNNFISIIHILIT